MSNLSSPDTNIVLGSLHTWTQLATQGNQILEELAVQYQQPQETIAHAMIQILLTEDTGEANNWTEVEWSQFDLTPHLPPVPAPQAQEN